MLFLLILPFSVGAADFCGSNSLIKVPCPLGTGTFPSGQQTAGGLALSIINIALLIVGSLAVIFLIYGGFRYLTARGNEEQNETAKNIIRQSILGLVIVILSMAVINIIANILINGKVI